MKPFLARAFVPLAMTLSYLFVLAFFFAQVEIQIEGAAGWAANLPTWRVEGNRLLDWFWGGRAMTGYHAWMFTFMALVFHLPHVLLHRWSFRIELRILGLLGLFWVIEDWLWFAMNPAFGLERFVPQFVPWHKHWLGPVPSDYWVFGGVGLPLLIASYVLEKDSAPTRRAE